MNSNFENASFWDIRREKKFVSLITIENDEINRIEEKEIEGTGIRTFENGTWSLFFSNNDEKIRKKRKKGKQKIVNKKPIKGRYKLPAKKDVRNIDLEEKIKLLKEIKKQFEGKKIKSVSITLYAFHRTMEYVDSLGSNASQEYPITSVFVNLVGKENSRLERYTISFGDSVGLELLDEKNWEKIARETKQKVYDLLKAKKIKGGHYNAILDNELAGVFIHEALGHAAELDHAIESHTILSNQEGKKIAPDFFNLISTHTKKSFGFYFFDDEGIKSGKNLLVDKGILKNFLYDRRTASELNSIPQGNGRRESFAHPVNVRMSNTYFGPGDYTLEELISEIKYGVILIHGYFGMEDPLGGGMQCTSKKAYLIENGEKTQILKATALSGAVLELLQNIDGVSKDATKLDAGICGKGSEDYVPVTSGGSFIRVKNALISQG